MNSGTWQDMARFIDHTLLRPDATNRDIERLCREAIEYGFFSVCINPYFIGAARKALTGSTVRISSVIGFPLGMMLPGVKIYEARDAVLHGADELDIVMNIGAARSGNWSDVATELSDIVKATPGTLHKIIMEACYLNDDEKTMAVRTVISSGAEFIKTSTGFGPAGATIRDVELIRDTAKGAVKIKAAGRIRTLKDVRAFIEAGAARIGTSSGVNIMGELKSEGRTC